MEHEVAHEILGLETGADLDQIKRRFRALAHDLHPDRGGDPRAFHDLQVAYRLLCRELEAPDRPARPRVARGRPSRPAPDLAPTSAPSLGDTPLQALTIDELREVLDDRRRVLDGELLARLLLSGPAAAHLHRLVSRAPGARSNRLSGLLDSGLTSTLTLQAEAAAVRIELSARGRGARRAVTGLDVASLSRATWTRRRGDAVTLVAGEIARSVRTEVGARLTVEAVTELLDALAWPLADWRLDRGMIRFDRPRTVVPPTF
jgi:hypothetical protein